MPSCSSEPAEHPSFSRLVMVVLVGTKPSVARLLFQVSQPHVLCKSLGAIPTYSDSPSALLPLVPPLVSRRPPHFFHLEASRMSLLVLLTSPLLFPPTSRSSAIRMLGFSTQRDAAFQTSLRKASTFQLSSRAKMDSSRAQALQHRLSPALLRFWTTNSLRQERVHSGS